MVNILDCRVSSQPRISSPLVSATAMGRRMKTGSCDMWKEDKNRFSLLTMLQGENIRTHKAIEMKYDACLQRTPQSKTLKTHITIWLLWNHFGCSFSSPFSSRSRSFWIYTFIFKDFFWSSNTSSVLSFSYFTPDPPKILVRLEDIWKARVRGANRRWWLTSCDSPPARNCHTLAGSTLNAVWGEEKCWNTSEAALENVALKLSYIHTFQ